MDFLYSRALRPPRAYIFRSQLPFSSRELSGTRRRQFLTPRVAKCGLSTSEPDNPEQGTSKVPLRLMPLGGSITYGVGSPDANGYRKALEDILVSRGHPTKMVGSRKSGRMTNNAHEGWRGLRIDQIHEKARKSTAKFQPNLFTINAGSNDCIQDFEIESVHTRLEALIEDRWGVGLGGSATVILSTLVVAADERVNGRVLRVNDHIRLLVRKKAAMGRNIVLADMCSSKGGPEVGDLVDDGVHPNYEGYVKMARIWADSIDEAVRAGFLHQPWVYSDIGITK